MQPDPKFIGLYNFSNPATEFEDYLEANVEIMSEYAEAINYRVKKELKVIVAIPPTCLNATILCELVTTVKLENIVAVTADAGFSTLNAISERLEVAVGNLTTPPVYGFLNLNQLVDIGNIFEKVELVKSAKRKVSENKPPKTHEHEVVVELRPLIYETHNITNLWRQIGTQQVNLNYNLLEN